MTRSLQRKGNVQDPVNDSHWLENVRQELANARAGIAARYARLSRDEPEADPGHDESSDNRDPEPPPSQGEQPTSA
jgi:hypothetical protein